MTSSKRRLRVGLLLDSLDAPAWVVNLLVRIQKSDYAEFSLVILNGQPPEKSSKVTKLFKNWRYLFYYIYFKLDRILFRITPDAFEEKNVSDLLRDVPKISVKAKQEKFADYFSPEDISTIKTFQIDVFIRFGFRILKGDILRVPAFGIWSYHHGDNQINRGGPAGFWEIFERQSATGTTLQILTEDLDNGVILSKSYSATEMVSLNRNRNRFYWKSLSLLPRKLEELHRLGHELFFDQVRKQNAALSFYSNRLYKTPGNGEFLILFLRHLVRYCRMKTVSFFFREQWFLMYKYRDNPSSSFWSFKRLVPPKDRFWADPYILSHQGLNYIFIEEFPFDQNKGHISVITSSPQAAITTPPVKVLEREYHLSSPFVFEWNGDHYMLPETDQNRTIEIYKCMRFPDTWELHQTLMTDIKAVDPVLFCHENRWWLFTNIAENEGATTLDELFIYYADNPLSHVWTPHPQNSVVSDARRSRPAGRIFVHDGKIYRPSQDCAEVYGYGIRINEITQLTTETYEEKETAFIEPRWSKDLLGVHTFNFANGLIVIDGKRRQLYH